MCLGAVNYSALSQIYVPVAVSGFNNDAVAESGTNALLQTSTDLDLSAHVIFSNTFATANGLTGGLPDNGVVQTSDGTHTWQLAPYTGNNALYLSLDPKATAAVKSGTLTLNTPADYARVSLLVFGTENGSYIDIVYNFADGSSYDPGLGYEYDWFKSNPGPVYTGYGRITRAAAAPFNQEGGPGTGLGELYSSEAYIPCAQQTVPLTSITINFVSNTATPNGRLVVMALAGVPFTPPTVTGTITDATCSNSNGSIALSVAGGNPPYRYAWSPTTPIQRTATATGLSAQTYTCTLTDANNLCTLTYTGTVGTKPLGVIDATASPDAICQGQSSVLTAASDPGGPAVTGYVWSPGGAPGASMTVSPTATTTYTVSGTDANGCAVSSTVDVTLKAGPTSTFTAAPDTICQGSNETIQYTGSAASTATYDWFGFGGGAVQGGTGAGPYTVQFNTPGTVTLQLQVTDGGCVSTVTTQQFVVSGKPSPAFAVDQTSICAGQPIAVTYTGDQPGASKASWNWDGGFATGNGFGPYKVILQNTATIDMSVTNGACTVTADPVTIQVTPQPHASFVPKPDAGCINTTVNFDNESSSADSYTWTFGDGSTSTDASPSHVYATEGNYTVTLAASNSNTCFNTLTLTDVIHISAPPVLEFSSIPDSNTEVILRDATFTFTNLSSGADKYLWNFGDGGTSQDASPTYKYMHTGDFTVTLYGTHGYCSDSVSHRFYKVVPDPDIRIPNAFSPNGDGINDSWVIDDLNEYPDCRVSIFNRWGQQLFQSTGYSKPWDGTMNGKVLPLATYYYIITIPGRKPYSGWVVLLK